MESHSTGSSFPQYLTTVIVSLTTLNYGILVAWLAPVLPLLQSSTAPVIGSAPLSNDDISFAGALVYVGALIGCFLVTGVANRFGRKRATIFILLPYVISSGLLVFTSSPLSLYSARVIGGIGNAGGLINSPMYVAEIANSRLRDRLVPFLLLSSCLGTLYAFAFGWLLPYPVFNCVNLAIAVFSLLCAFYLTESPVYHLKQNQLHKAKQCIMWLRHYKEDNEKDRAQLELDLNVLDSSFLNKDSQTPWRDLLIPSTTNALLIAIGLIINQQMSAIAIVSVYALTFFQTADLPTSLISPHVSLIILAFAHLPGAFASLLFVKKFDRKNVLITANLVIALCLLSMGSFYYLQSIHFKYMSHISLVPVIFLFLYIVMVLFANPVYFILMSEIFPAEARNVCSGIVIMVQFIVMSSLIRLYPFLSRHLELYGCMWMFSGVLVIAIVFIYFLVPETRNKSFREIVGKLTSGKTQSSANSKTESSYIT